MAGKVLACLNFKGGVGKTTMAANLGWSIHAFSKKKVCIIDLDPQFNLTQLLFRVKDREKFEDEGRTASRLFQRRAGDIRASERSKEGATDPFRLINNVGPASPFMHVIAGSFELMKTAIAQSRVDNHAASALMFREFIGFCRQNYDLTMLDLNPGGSIITFNALDVSDQVLCPITGDKFSYTGLTLIHEFVADYLPNKARPEFYSVIENNIPEDELSRRAGKEAQSPVHYQISRDKVFSTRVLPQVIPESKLLEARLNTGDLFFYRTVAVADKEKQDALAAVFKAAAEELCKRLEI